MMIYLFIFKVQVLGSKLFVVVMWNNYIVEYSDYVFVFFCLLEGWGWFIDKGFRVIEINFVCDLICYFNVENRCIFLLDDQDNRCMLFCLLIQDVDIYIFYNECLIVL